MGALFCPSLAGAVRGVNWAPGRGTGSFLVLFGASEQLDVSSGNLVATALSAGFEGSEAQCCHS